MSKLCVVVEDAEVLSLLGRTLRDGGLEVDLLGRRDRAPELVGTRWYDLILLDVGLPEDDGLRVLQELRAKEPSPQVLVISAQDDCANRVRCLDLGACDFVGKPFEIAELLARVRARLRPLTHGNGHGYLGAGPARLDLVRHRLVLRDRTVPLATREFLLLEYLMQKSGEVCARKELMTAVWGYDFESDTNVVDVYVSRLRSKIPGGLIETVRHVGYCFVGG